MGGNKKKPTQSNASKSQENKNTNKEDTKKTTTSKPHQKQKLSVLIEENSGMKAIGSMKAITVQGLARNLGVKISVANNYIKNLENKNIIRNVGGFSGHKIYQKIK
ncbi:MAG: MarR family transcriptional regulator [Nitrosopumilus sp.]|nr:MarR family transcriptional regulator [Nitrosopumilus sp.]